MVVAINTEVTADTEDDESTAIIAGHAEVAADTKDASHTEVTIENRTCSACANNTAKKLEKRISLKICVCIERCCILWLYSLR